MAAVGKITLDTAVLDRITRELRPKAEQNIAKWALKIEGDTKTTIEAKKIIDTGALWNSIEAEPKQGNRMLWWIHDGVEYGIWQELGTYKMAARPFMLPSLEKNRRGFDESWGEVLK